MTRWWMLVIGLAACGSAQPAPVPVSTRALEPWAADCAPKETFVEAGDSALEGVIVDCLTGEKVPGLEVSATDRATQRYATTTSDAAGRYRLQLPEGRYNLLVLGFSERDMHVQDTYIPEIEIRAQHVTVKEIRLVFARCPPALALPAVAPQADRAALLAAVLAHHAAAGIVDAPPRSDSGPTYVTIKGLRTLALPPSIARQYIVTTQDDLQREATRSGRKIPFINIFGLEITGSCATVSVGGDFVVPGSEGKLCCCQETEVFLLHGGRWVFRMSETDLCS